MIDSFDRLFDRMSTVQHLEPTTLPRLAEKKKKDTEKLPAKQSLEATTVQRQAKQGVEHPPLRTGAALPEWGGEGGGSARS